MLVISASLQDSIFLAEYLPLCLYQLPVLIWLFSVSVILLICQANLTVLLEGWVGVIPGVEGVLSINNGGSGTFLFYRRIALSFDFGDFDFGPSKCSRSC